MKYNRTTIKVAIHREDLHPMHGCLLSVDDAGGGAYLIIEQGGKSITLDPEELELIAATGKEMIEQSSLKSDER